MLKHDVNDIFAWLRYIVHARLIVNPIGARCSIPCRHSKLICDACGWQLQKGTFFNEEEIIKVWCFP
jgi:hypothetical protein